MNSRIVCFLLLILFAVTLCPARAQGGTDQKAIDARREAFVAAFNKGDIAGMQKIFEPDMLLLTFDGQPVIGGKGIAMGMASMSAQTDLDLKPLRTRVSGDLITEAGTWSHFKKGTKAVKKLGTFILVWKKEKDSWRIDTLSVTSAPGTPIEIGS